MNEFELELINQLKELNKNTKRISDALWIPDWNEGSDDVTLSIGEVLWDLKVEIKWMANSIKEIKEEDILGVL